MSGPITSPFNKNFTYAQASLPDLPLVHAHHANPQTSALCPLPSLPPPPSLSRNYVDCFITVLANPIWTLIALKSNLLRSPYHIGSLTLLQHVTSEEVAEISVSMECFPLVCTNIKKSPMTSR